ARPSGPYERSPTRAVGRSPRRVGTSLFGSFTAAPGAMAIRRTDCAAPADGTHASRISPVSRRGPALATVSVTVAGSPSLTWRAPSRRMVTADGEAATAKSTAVTSAISPAYTATPSHGAGHSGSVTAA